ncbi:MAG: histidine phosphatase family protein [Gemmatimonadaceae bacterium]
MNDFSGCPNTLFVVRHGESAGNLARNAANAAKALEIHSSCRDVDVPLSPLGERQSTALGHWFGALPIDQRPTVVITSPYLRARQTTDTIKKLGHFRYATDSAGSVQDERFREKEFGILDGLTKYGILARFPEQAALRTSLGKFYHRPPGGESWCDVVLRLRGAFEMMCREFDGERVLVVAHSVVVLCMRYIIEGLTEQDILAIDRSTEVANCSLTRFDVDSTNGKAGRLTLDSFNFVAPLHEEGARVTSASDIPLN